MTYYLQHDYRRKEIEPLSDIGQCFFLELYVEVKNKFSISGLTIQFWNLYLRLIKLLQ